MTTELPINTIIVAAGTSARFGTDKMLAPLGDLPVFLHSVRNFLPVSQRLVLVVPPGREEDFAALARQHGLLAAQMSIVAGGDTRTDSVRQGLQGLGDSASGLVAIHDAARPLASADLLLALADLAAKTGGAAPAKPMTNTVLRTDDQNLVLEALSRENLWEIETPQVFVLPILQEAFAALSG
ncbi:MAG: 2-C-methyl-D-erythritol 4-phosphate cytidylyltransferase, partial [Victivallales bacterium]|nr:2-C-methyl-D-erythritol 4-phosphate cytidylyltransferase [Victivallales bacterium]